jgi:hypothetical protein
MLSPSDMPKVLGIARTPEELFGLVRQIKDANLQSLLLYRGQTQLYATVRSGKARGLPLVGEVEVAWTRLAGKMLGVEENDTPGTRFSKALLQHYGLPTELVDLTAHPGIAAWFATHQFKFNLMMWGGSELRAFKRVKYASLSEGTGQVVVFGFPDASALETSGHLFCLSQLPTEVLRPHRQLGWLFYDGSDRAHDINSYCLGAISIDRTMFQLPDLSQERLFPPPTSDIAYRHLLGFPWVQMPTLYLRKPNDKPEDEKEKYTDRWCFAHRALETPEYFDNDKAGYDHKWDDITLYEPHPVRMWRGWTFDLSTRFPQWTGNIAEAVKITVSERARELLEAADANVPCAWPAVEASDIFFSHSQMGHDKVIDNGPPYCGVWLHREGDWIVETVTEADEDVLNLGPGLVYTIRDGQLIPHHIPNTCECGDTESHVRRVGSMLRLHHLIATGDVVFVPHPGFLPRWFVAV